MSSICQRAPLANDLLLGPHHFLEVLLGFLCCLKTTCNKTNVKNPHNNNASKFPWGKPTSHAEEVALCVNVSFIYLKGKVSLSHITAYINVSTSMSLALMKSLHFCLKCPRGPISCLIWTFICIKTAARVLKGLSSVSTCDPHWSLEEDVKIHLPLLKWYGRHRYRPITQASSHFLKKQNKT